MSEIPPTDLKVDGHLRRVGVLIILSLGALMINADISIVNVALPVIKADLGFSEPSLIWVVDAYLATFGAFLLPAGKLGDSLGHRRAFLLGTALFTLASLACGLAWSKQSMVLARAIQGFGAAIVSVLAIPLSLRLFTGAPGRAKALGIYSFISVSGGSIGLLLGGALTATLGWHWIFLVNVPAGMGICALGVFLLPRCLDSPTSNSFDLSSMVIITMAVLTAIYVIVNGNHNGWSSAFTVTGLAFAAFLLLIFVGIQSRAQTPLMPLTLFQNRNVLIANVACVLAYAATFGWFFVYARYLQAVLNYDPVQVGLAYLPANLMMGFGSTVVSPILIARFGIRQPLVVGFILAAAGLAFLTRAPVHSREVIDVLPGMLLLGAGVGAAQPPLMMGALNSVALRYSGIATGIIRTTSLMGGALGLSFLSRIASTRTEILLVSGSDLQNALKSGYQVSLAVAATLFALAALFGTLLTGDDGRKAA